MTSVPPGDIIEQAVRSAGRAPSLHNAQPWRWVFEQDRLRLYAVRERMLPGADTTGRQMILGCGIALDHLRVASAALGWRTLVAYLPDPNRRDHLATVRFVPTRAVTGIDRERAEAIERRRTNRLPFGAPPHWDDTEAALRTALDPEDAALTVLAENCRPALTHASQLTRALRRFDSEYQIELRWWTGHLSDTAGVPPTALLTADEQQRVPVGRAFPTTGAEPRHPRIEADRSRILVLSTPTDGHLDLLRCGAALSTLLLECTRSGYATCPLTHLTEFPRSRTVVRNLIEAVGLPQVLVRVGAVPESADRPPSTPRLPLADILHIVERPADDEPAQAL
ncbi:Acg family FMN-binding oxidoreductase [Nocardia terpenica]|uniref:NAD(P)H nitroreductase n=1 Tax=Nocardia terpenica TaxID=455432 RepID=A0A164NTY1_9NOCA|nr:NAD(P)H nitroreductase [Nocardia terpenica]KZM74721.1 NAD(P)H nitroreductase [Nocardia terpenica]NQE93661.1 NAD(P)H nitroreductase [Nocardia terpenica]